MHMNLKLNQTDELRTWIYSSVKFLISLMCQGSYDAINAGELLLFDTLKDCTRLSLRGCRIRIALTCRTIYMQHDVKTFQDIFFSSWSVTLRSYVPLGSLCDNSLITKSLHIATGSLSLGCTTIMGSLPWSFGVRILRSIILLAFSISVISL
jgi:hypothetical protein